VSCLWGEKFHGENLERFLGDKFVGWSWFSFENAGKISREKFRGNWAGAKTGKVDDDGELEVDGDEEDTG
jgi:hypothetical protein